MILDLIYINRSGKYIIYLSSEAQLVLQVHGQILGHRENPQKPWNSVKKKRTRYRAFWGAATFEQAKS